MDQSIRRLLFISHSRVIGKKKGRAEQREFHLTIHTVYILVVHSHFFNDDIRQNYPEIGNESHTRQAVSDIRCARRTASRLSMDIRFGEIAKQAPPAPAPRIQQQANVIIPYSRQELFGNKRPAALSIAARLKKVLASLRCVARATRPRRFSPLDAESRRQ